jgi:hypothetical protein
MIYDKNQIIIIFPEAPGAQFQGKMRPRAKKFEWKMRARSKKNLEKNFPKIRHFSKN